jgi:hypothetical protein
MDILIALFVVIIAWFIFKSLWAVILIAIAVAVVLWILRLNGRY